jgi:hypothetical protein
MDDHVVWDELAAGYALDALSQDEELTFTSHLETCARCQENVDDHTLVAAQLGAMAMPDEAVDTPSWDSMRELIMGQGEHDGAVGELPPLPVNVVDLAARRRRYDGSRRILAAAAAVVLLAGGGIVAWRLQSGSSTPGAVKACGTTPGCHTVALASGSKTAASLTVQDDVITMIPTGMKPAPAGSEYVLWQQPADGRPVAVKVFTATGSDAVATATTSVPYSDTTSFAVSEEHNGPVPAKPTTPLLAVGNAT